MSLNLDYIPSHIKTVVVVNDFDYVEGGAAKVAMMTAETLVDAGYSIYLFSAVTKKDAPKIDGVKYVSTNQYPSLSDPNKIRGALNGLYNFKAAICFKKLLKTLDNKTTLIHIHTWTKALSSCVWNVANSLHFPVYLTCHDYFSVCPNGGFFDYKKLEICHRKPLSMKCLRCNCDSRNYAIKLYRFVRCFVQNKIVNIFKKTTKFISISDFSERILKIYFLQNTVFHRVSNPIDKINLPTIHPEKNEYFLYVGRLAKEKGVDLFCQAIGDLGLKGVVVGDGPELESLKKQFAKSNVEFVGWKSRNEVFEYMKKARALVFPSRWYETDGLSVREALSIGLPCIVSNCCAAREYVTDSSKGFVFNTINELKKYLIKM